MPKLVSSGQRGFASILLFLLLLGGLAVGVFLIKNQQIFKSSASSDFIIVEDIKGNLLPISNKVPQTESPSLTLVLNSPLGLPVIANGFLSSNTLYTKFVKIAESPGGLNNASPLPYISNPTTLPYVLKDTTLGEKFIWVRFIQSTGKAEDHSVVVNLRCNTAGGKCKILTPTPGPSLSPTPPWYVTTTPPPPISSVPSPTPRPSISITPPQITGGLSPSPVPITSTQ